MRLKGHAYAPLNNELLNEQPYFTVNSTVLFMDYFSR